MYIIKISIRHKTQLSEYHTVVSQHIIGLANKQSRVRLTVGLLSTLGNGQEAVTLCGWEGNHRSGIAPACAPGGTWHPLLFSVITMTICHETTLCGDTENQFPHHNVTIINSECPAHSALTRFAAIVLYTEIQLNCITSHNENTSLTSSSPPENLQFVCIYYPSVL